MKALRPRHLSGRAKSEAGYSLVEMLTALSILTIVLGGLATMFHAGVRAELRANREVEAQQNARVALDLLRRELHCANAITASAGAVATIAVTLPTACTGSDTSVTYATTSVAASRWKLTRTGNSTGATDVADYLTTSTPFTYDAPASGTLGRLAVDLPINLNPTDSSTQWRLQDDIVLRNTSRL